MTKWIVSRVSATNEAANDAMTEDGWKPFAVDGGYIYWRKSA